MAIATGTALAIAGGAAALGAGAGALKDRSQQTQASGLNMDPASALENQASGVVSHNLSSLSDLVNRGPGASDIDASLSSSRDLAAMLARYSQEGGSNPTAGDISSSNELASKVFGAQRTALSQSFEDQLMGANRQAALMGRDINDPILRAKLAQEQTRQSSLLDSQQTAWSTQNAMQQPFQRLAFAGQRNDLLGGLATQALANRQAMLGIGSGVLGAERNFRLSTATHWGNQDQTSGGGLKGLLQGGLAGFGAGASVASGFMGGMPSPAPSTTPNFQQAQNFFAQPSYPGMNFGQSGQMRSPSLFGN